MVKKVDLLSLELTNCCNFDCNFCANRFMTRKKGFMDKALAKRLIKETHDHSFSGRIVTNVMGEPLLHKDLFEILDYAGSLKQPITVITNGALLNPETDLRLLRNPSVSIGISYHANDEASFSFRNSGITYEKYRARIYELIELKYREKRKTDIYVDVLSTCNMPHGAFKVLHDRTELDSFGKEWVAFARSLKKKYGIRWWIPHKLFRGTTYLLPELMLGVLDIYHLWSNTILPSDAKVMQSKKCTCSTIFDQCNILWNGDIAQCCIDYNGDLVFDNVNGKDLLQAFNSPKAQSLRNGFIEGHKVHPKCLQCWGVPVNSDGSIYYEKRNMLKSSYIDQAAKHLNHIYALKNNWKLAGFFMKQMMKKLKRSR